MSKPRPSQRANTPPAPFGTEPRRPRGPLALLIVLCAGWLIFLAVLAVRQRLHS
jgi:hypothetical protein